MPRLAPVTRAVRPASFIAAPPPLTWPSRQGSCRGCRAARAWRARARGWGYLPTGCRRRCPSYSPCGGQSSHRHGYGIVVQQSALDGSLPLARGLQIAALFPRPQLHVCATYLTRSLVAGERLLDRSGKLECPAEYEAILDGDTGALAKEGGHRMRRVTEHRDPALGPAREGLAVAQPPFEQRPGRDAADHRNDLGRKIRIGCGKLLVRGGNRPALLLPGGGPAGGNKIHDPAAAQRIVQQHALRPRIHCILALGDCRR